jgi:hypothetical protein
MILHERTRAVEELHDRTGAVEEPHERTRAVEELHERTRAVTGFVRIRLPAFKGWKPYLNKSLF